MSEFYIKVVEVGDIKEHPNADRMELCMIGGWQCCVQINHFSVGDKAVYIPIDSVLPENIEAKIFGEDAKVKLHNHRVRSIKLRGALSQGLVVSLTDLGLSESYCVGKDLKKILGITKYEPPVKGMSSSMNVKKASRYKNPHFKKYTDINHLKNYPQAFDGKYVNILEKIHGTNFRASKVQYNPYSFWKRLLQFFKLNPGFEFCMGSHNVDLTMRGNKSKVFYKKNVYAEISERYDFKNMLKDGEGVYGEIYGPSIQKGYHYGLKNDEIDLAVFDVIRNEKYLNTREAVNFCKARGLIFVPILYTGEYHYDIVQNLAVGNSVFCPSQKVIEGVVVKTVKEEVGYYGRSILKFLGDAYLLNKNNTDFH